MLGSKYDSCMADAAKLKSDPVTGPLLANTSQEQVAAMIGYTSSDYQILNAALRSKDPVELARLKPYIDNANAGLASLPNYSGPVYRGIDSTRMPPDVVAQYLKPGEVITERAYVSTSYVAGANFPGDLQLTVMSKTGKQIDFLSMYAGEKEVLFAPGTSFKVLSVTDIGGGKKSIKLMEM